MKTLVALVANLFLLAIGAVLLLTLVIISLSLGSLSITLNLWFKVDKVVAATVTR